MVYDDSMVPEFITKQWMVWDGAKWRKAPELRVSGADTIEPKTMSWQGSSHRLVEEAAFEDAEGVSDAVLQPRSEL